MFRFVLILIAFSSQLALANDISTFFDKLQGKWMLKEGQITNIDPKSGIGHLKITDLVSTVEKSSDKEWKFVEHYCVEAECFDSVYFYVLEKDEDLFLVTPEGRTQLVIVHTENNQLKFLLQNNDSYSMTDCTLSKDNEMIQEGYTMNSDFSESIVKISLTKSE